MIQKSILFCLALLVAQAIGAQNANMTGSVKDAENSGALPDVSVVVAGTGRIATTDAKGEFVFDALPVGTYSFIISRAGYIPSEIYFNVEATKVNRLEVALQRDPHATDSNGEIPTLTLEEAEAETEGASEVANLLNASRDVFQQVSGFGWSAFRFRERGYDSEHFPLYLNGVDINDPETGNTVFGEIAGLNDVLRNRETSIGLSACDFAFSEIGGATRLDTRASSQRKQIRASYAVSNRTYTNRVMLTAGTGLMPGGWAVSLSGSRRWGNEGYYEGTFVDGYSYFLSVDKKFGTKHSLNLTFLGAPNKRGRVGDTTDEMYELAGTHRYNPNWGFQNGEKRNAYVGHAHQPIGILRYDWSPYQGTSVMLAAYTQAGARGDTRLEWFEANNPAPDFNRRMPSSIEEPTLAADWAQAMRADKNLRQIDWHNFYDVNRRNTVTINNVEGIAGNSLTGARSQYIVEDQRADSKELGANGVLNQRLNQRSKLQAGLHYRWYTGQNFKVIDDLLGGDFWLDINKYASQDYPGQPEKEDNDALNPVNAVREGDVFGYNYNENIRDGGSWVQVQTDLNRFSLFGAVEIGLTQFWRTGKMLNPRFPDNSLGDSPKESFYTYGAKAGATFKINGRNYLYANGFAGTKPPQFRDIFLSPRNRNSVVPGGGDVYSVQSIEGGFIHRAPGLRLRATGYLTNFKDETDANTYFAATLGEFSTLLRTGVDRTHMGVELGFDYKISPSWSVSGGGNLGYYHYTSRPLMYYTPDNFGTVGFDSIYAYQDNFLVSRTPQTAASLTLEYQGKRFWFASLTANWRDDFWYSFDALRRRAEAVLNLDPGSDIWNLVVQQKKAPAAYTLDFYGGKSWKINKVFLFLNVGVNNILDNRDIIVSGREAYRSAYGREPENEQLYTTEVQYGYGLNYFISLGIRM